MVNNRQYLNEAQGLPYADVKFLDIYQEGVVILKNGLEKIRKAPLVIASTGNYLVVYEITLTDNDKRMKIKELSRITHPGTAVRMKVLRPKTKQFNNQNKRTQSSTVFTTSSNGSLYCFQIRSIHFGIEEESQVEIIQLNDKWEGLHSMCCTTLDTCFNSGGNELTIVTGGEDGIVNVLHLRENDNYGEDDSYRYSTKFLLKGYSTGLPITDVRYQIRDGVPGISNTQK
ncbi:hypothetical protein AKO1_001830, partial [Acrasis kona]